MKIIGLCGRSGSGKSECSRFISDMGIVVIDSDKVYRNLTEKGSLLLDELTNFYGNVILDSNGNLDRKKLAEIVFGDDSLLSQLNKITHKHILISIIQWAEKASLNSRGGLAVVQAPLLFESGFDKKCEIIVSVIASEEQCLQRLQTRDGLTAEQALIRLSKQKDNDFLKQNSNYIIKNYSGITELKNRTEKVFEEILGGS